MKVLIESLLKKEVCSVRKIFAPYDDCHHYNTRNRLYIIAANLNLTINFLDVSCLKIDAPLKILTNIVSIDKN